MEIESSGEIDKADSVDEDQGFQEGDNSEHTTNGKSTKKMVSVDSESTTQVAKDEHDGSGGKAIEIENPVPISESEPSILDIEKNGNANEETAENGTPDQAIENLLPSSGTEEHSTSAEDTTSDDDDKNLTDAEKFAKVLF